MKFDLPVWGLQENDWRIAEGAELVDVAPHLSGTFAVHINPWDGLTWRVSNVETGTLVREPLGLFEDFTKREAIQRARRLLLPKTEDEYQLALKKLSRKYPEVTR